MSDSGIPKGEFGGVPYEDLYLVRVQNSLSSDTLENGMLVLNRQGSGLADSRNTFHFAINAVVENHVMGKQFNSAECVIIAPLLRTVRDGQNIPNGFNPVDTYFEADPEGKMRIPGARLLAPEGKSVPAELEHLTERYKRGNTPEETYSNRNNAVRAIFGAMNVPIFKASDKDWSDAPFNDKGHAELSRALVSKNETFVGLHSNSPSAHWSRIRNEITRNLRDYTGGQRLYTRWESGEDISLYDKIRSTQDRMQKFIDERKENNADPKAIAHYDRQFKEIMIGIDNIRPIRAQELREGRAADRAYKAEQAALRPKLQPPPLPATMPPPLPPSGLSAAGLMPPPLPHMVPPSLPSNLQTLDQKASKGLAVADVAVALANGNIGQAAASATTTLAVGAATSETASKGLATAFKAAGFAAKRVPGIGAIVTAGFVATEASAHALKGEWGKAGAAIVAGGAETAGNLVGFGVGDAARETVRAGIIAGAGEQYAPDKSGIRQVAEGTYEVAKKLTKDSDTGMIVTASSLDKSPAVNAVFSAAHNHTEPVKKIAAPQPAQDINPILSLPI